MVYHPNINQHRVMERQQKRHIVQKKTEVLDSIDSIYCSSCLQRGGQNTIYLRRKLMFIS